MEDTREDAGPSEPGSSNANWWPSGLMDKLRSVSLAQEESLNGKEMYNPDRDDLSLQTASQILWTTGTLSGAIPNGFYSVIPEKKLKEHFDHIPSPEEIHALGLEGFRADIILVDGEKDKKLSLLKNLMVASVRGSNPAAMIKKIAGLVSDFYKRPASELSPAKAALEDNSHFSESRGVQLLGQIKNGLCRPRAILFKVLADTVGLESRLVVGLPTDGAIEHTDSYKHMSVIVVLNSVELLVDLMRFPGQLIPYSSRAVFMSHISAAGESDSAENDSCDSPLEPNSPLYGFSDRADVEGSPEQDDTLHCLYQRKFEASSASGSPARNIMLRRTTSSEGKLSLSHSDPNIANNIWRRSRRKVIAEQRTASSSPEHPLFRGRGRSMLSGSGRQSFREYADDLTPSRSDGTSTSETRRIRRRSISITPEIGDDIVRAVRAMNETLKQNRLLKQQGHDGSVSNSPTKLDSPDLHKNLPNFSLDERDKISSEISGRYSHPGKQPSSQTAVSLPSSPRAFRGHDSERSARPHFVGDEFISTWNKVLESSTFLNKPLLPFQEWNIDYSELTVGTRVGIGFFGEVFRGIWNGTDVAIKVFLEQDLTAENMEDFCNEISILSRLRHPNVILFLGACTRPPHLSMVTEYMEMGSLYYLIHMSGQKKKLSLRRRLKMLRDICRGLMCIHRMKIVHRDVKSANCLVNKHYMVKICDFGLSRVMAESPMRDTSSAGTPEWMAPELIRNEPFTEKCDVFSLGVIMWELCTLNRPWEGVSPMQVVYAVANEGSRLEIPEGPLGKLIQDCWAEPDDRPSCEEILTRLLDCEYALC
ncbi:probable serine/threonine-protein kinase SIS8 isoform X1 [Papaver somniferum]|uniref:probable serine/threonine-protein kinase SIS8 isoform X1 n=1 Tax=Papaver somniferum TaxID=3469 RepID=UPI000E6FB85C|nr:probable serine/threonine-protein kinase SIS8 isoform X1 [Papaver somniferum]XP_026401172.1 probable serine/threonine-protein kinase SIS8 isoform X1 [Papaver somniferum]XP_026401173.1 probable serine/threonine-protein kinase SIS8 isoform X1 [Papaver somniferum]XP_026401174.1 probable serine/threonine-protein kinase SIS8 isoform X1 [Papaver somniferum]XP_026401175.1 probable serine/threonine-protein kinase SIS8 isoform X1 [Papaver somniferum]